MKLIVSAHGMLAKEVVNSAGMVFGAIDDLDIVTFVPGENAETLKARSMAIRKTKKFYSL